MTERTDSSPFNGSSPLLPNPTDIKELRVALQTIVENKYVRVNSENKIVKASLSELIREQLKGMFRLHNATHNRWIELKVIEILEEGIGKFEDKDISTINEVVKKLGLIQKDTKSISRHKQLNEIIEKVNQAKEQTPKTLTTIKENLHENSDTFKKEHKSLLNRRLWRNDTRIPTSYPKTEPENSKNQPNQEIFTQRSNKYTPQNTSHSEHKDTKIVEHVTPPPSTNPSLSLAQITTKQEDTVLKEQNEEKILKDEENPHDQTKQHDETKQEDARNKNQDSDPFKTSVPELQTTPEPQQVETSILLSPLAGQNADFKKDGNEDSLKVMISKVGTSVIQDSNAKPTKIKNQNTTNFDEKIILKKTPTKPKLQLKKETTESTAKKVGRIVTGTLATMGLMFTAYYLYKGFSQLHPDLQTFNDPMTSQQTSYYYGTDLQFSAVPFKSDNPWFNETANKTNQEQDLTGAKEENGSAWSFEKVFSEGQELIPNNTTLNFPNEGDLMVDSENLNKIKDSLVFIETPQQETPQQIEESLKKEAPLKQHFTNQTEKILEPTPSEFTPAELTYLQHSPPLNSDRTQEENSPKTENAASTNSDDTNYVASNQGDPIIQIASEVKGEEPPSVPSHDWQKMATVVGTGIFVSALVSMVHPSIRSGFSRLLFKKQVKQMLVKEPETVKNKQPETVAEDNDSSHHTSTTPKTEDKTTDEVEIKSLDTSPHTTPQDYSSVFARMAFEFNRIDFNFPFSINIINKSDVEISESFALSSIEDELETRLIFQSKIKKKDVSEEDKKKISENQKNENDLQLANFFKEYINDKRDTLTDSNKDAISHLVTILKNKGMTQSAQELNLLIEIQLQESRTELLKDSFPSSALVTSKVSGSNPNNKVEEKPILESKKVGSEAQLGDKTLTYAGFHEGLDVMNRLLNEVTKDQLPLIHLEKGILSFKRVISNTSSSYSSNIPQFLNNYLIAHEDFIYPASREILFKLNENLLRLDIESEEIKTILDNLPENEYNRSLSYMTNLEKINKIHRTSLRLDSKGTLIEKLPEIQVNAYFDTFNTQNAWVWGGGMYSNKIQKNKFAYFFPDSSQPSEKVIYLVKNEINEGKNVKNYFQITPGDGDLMVPIKLQNLLKVLPIRSSDQKTENCVHFHLPLDLILDCINEPKTNMSSVLELTNGKNLFKLNFNEYDLNLSAGYENVTFIFNLSNIQSVQFNKGFSNGTAPKPPLVKATDLPIYPLPSSFIKQKFNKEKIVTVINNTLEILKKDDTKMLTYTFDTTHEQFYPIEDDAAAKCLEYLNLAKMDQLNIDPMIEFESSEISNFTSPDFMTNNITKERYLSFLFWKEATTSLVFISKKHFICYQERSIKDKEMIIYNNRKEKKLTIVPLKDFNIDLTLIKFEEEFLCIRQKIPNPPPSNPKQDQEENLTSQNESLSE